eukprot:TRINITY_DN4028_c0_g1_i1.p1 TRINITY_DN4028_c0_g1~~TRINITY_DN4028_c0_g1_i1.p1  ORF type:complete len:890 (+),score=183.35 TRINITY_DN4028_c0_g1_i1:121-2790(+)
METDSEDDGWGFFDEEPMSMEPKLGQPRTKSVEDLDLEVDLATVIRSQSTVSLTSVAESMYSSQNNKLSSVKSQLFKWRQSGSMWRQSSNILGMKTHKKHFFELCGRMIHYFDSSASSASFGTCKPKGSMELHEDTEVEIIQNDASFEALKLHGFLIRSPNSKQKPWRLSCDDIETRDQWMSWIQTSINLIERTQKPPKLPNMGFSKDHYEVVKYLYKKKSSESVRKSGIKHVAVVKRRATGAIRLERVYDKSHEAVGWRRFLTRELRYLRQICRTNSLLLERLYEVYESPSSFSLVTRPDIGDFLLFHLSKMQTFSESDVKTVMRSIIKAILLLHDNNIHHCAISPWIIRYRDLDPVSVGDIVVGGMGYAKTRSIQPMVPSFGLLGVPAFTAPEVIKTRGKFDDQAVVWSLGAMLCVLLFGYPPVSAENDGDVFRKTCSGNNWSFEAELSDKLTSSPLSPSQRKTFTNTNNESLAFTRARTNSEDDSEIRNIMISSLGNTPPMPRPHQSPNNGIPKGWMGPMEEVGEEVRPLFETQMSDLGLCLDDLENESNMEDNDDSDGDYNDYNDGYDDMGMQPPTSHESHMGHMGGYTVNHINTMDESATLNQMKPNTNMKNSASFSYNQSHGRFDKTSSLSSMRTTGEGSVLTSLNPRLSFPEPQPQLLIPPAFKNTLDSVVSLDKFASPTHKTVAPNRTLLFDTDSTIAVPPIRSFSTNTRKRRSHLSLNLSPESVTSSKPPLPSLSPLQQQQQKQHYQRGGHSNSYNTFNNRAPSLPCSREGIHLLRKMLSLDPSQRPRVSELAAHPYFNECSPKTNPLPAIPKRLTLLLKCWKRSFPLHGPKRVQDRSIISRIRKSISMQSLGSMDLHSNSISYGTLTPQELDKIRRISH